jgi:hypothetical protein
VNRQTAGVTWQDARAIGLKLVADALAGADPDAKVLLMPNFVSDEDCQFFIPDRSLAFHRMILKAAGRDARRRGVKLVTHYVTPRMYQTERRMLKLEDSPEGRTRYLSRQIKPVVT